MFALALRALSLFFPETIALSPGRHVPPQGCSLASTAVYSGLLQKAQLLLFSIFLLWAAEICSLLALAFFS